MQKSLPTSIDETLSLLNSAGYIADRIGLSQTLEWLALLPLVTAVAALFLPGGPRRR